MARQLASKQNNIVIATCRNPDGAADLKALQSTAQGALHILQLDMSSVESIDAIVKPVEEIVGNNGLDYLLNNAAMVRHDALPVSNATHPLSERRHGRGLLVQGGRHDANLYAQRRRPWSPRRGPCATTGEGQEQGHHEHVDRARQHRAQLRGQVRDLQR